MKILISFFIAILGGYIAYLLYIPLPWMLGALFTSILWNLTTKNFKPIPYSRKLGQFIIGFSLGLYFKQEIVDLILKNLALLFSGIFICLLISFLTIFINSRGHLSFATTYFTYLPGGASEMVNLSHQFNGDKTHIAIGHTVRIILLVFCVPILIKLLSFKSSFSLPPIVNSENHFSLSLILLLFITAILGVFFWKLLKQANPWMIGPLIGTGLITYFKNIDLQVPLFYLALAQIVLAMVLAEPITRKSINDNIYYLPKIFLSSFFMIFLLISISFFLGTFFKINYLTITLGIMPGGISEMSLTALQLNLNVAIVSTMQTIRLIIVMIIAKPFYILFNKIINNT